MKRILPLIMAVLVLVCLSLAGCASSPAGSGSALSPPDALAQVQAGAAYLDATLAKVESAVATAKAQSPDKAAAIEARLEPTVATLGRLVNAYDAAVSARDAPAADTIWSAARDGVSAALDAGIAVLGPQIILELLGS